MKNRTLLILVALFAVLAIAAFYPQLRQAVAPADTAVPIAEAPDLARLSADSVEKIVFGTPNQTITLQKQGDRWQINGKPAAQSEIDALFAALRETTIKELAGENPANHGEFGITDALATRLEIGDEVVLLGSGGVTPDSFYLRQKDAARVYLASGELAAKARQNADFWRDKKITDFADDEITRIEVSGPGSTYSLTKSVNPAPSASADTSPSASPKPPVATSFWTAATADKEIKLEPAIADKLAGIFSPLAASGFLSAEEATAFDNQKEGKWTITVFGEADKELARLDFSSDQELIKGRAKGQEDGFKMPAFNLNVFTTEIPVLLAPAQ